jgi:hypothetical protein
MLEEASMLSETPIILPGGFSAGLSASGLSGISSRLPWRTQGRRDRVQRLRNTAIIFDAFSSFASAGIGREASCRRLIFWTSIEFWVRNEAMATGMATGSKHPIDLEMRWNFSDSRSTSLSLDDFLAQKETDGVEFFAEEPWLDGLRKLSWQTFFRVCTEEMDDLSQRAVKLVIEYCLEVLEQVEETIRGKASLARLEAVLDVQYAELFENKVYQYRWALRHPVVKEAMTRAMGNRFPAR